ncbi:butyrophilin-like protein 9 [Liasis olivaceus]
MNVKSRYPDTSSTQQNKTANPYFILIVKSDVWRNGKVISLEMPQFFYSKTGLNFQTLILVCTASISEKLKEKNEFLGVRFYRVDLNLDPKTAHPRLEVSEDGKSVKDTGNIHDVSKSKERFECHTFVLAKQLFSEGRYYWEVEVGQKNMWDLGVASESAPRTGKITLSPQNGYWVIGHDNGKDYWARTDPWTCLNMPGKPNRIGIFLNMKSHEISFYVAQKKHKLYTFLNVASGKFYPFFSTGSVIGEEFDRGTLIIPPWFEGEEVVEENEMNN